VDKGARIARSRHENCESREMLRPQGDGLVVVCVMVRPLRQNEGARCWGTGARQRAREQGVTRDLREWPQA
jgi:hypothetical protein